MKRLSILLFFISSISYSQILSFDDIKQIDSRESYERVMIENGFDYVETVSVGKRGKTVLVYAYDYDKEEKTARIWFYHFWDNLFDIQTPYDDDYAYLFNEVKRSCNFFGIIENSINVRFSSYTCPGSKYPGKISFSKGLIQNLIPN